jgi:hypothetical protein
MMPDCGRVHLVSTENWFDRIVSADAAGIILTSWPLTVVWRQIMTAATRP